MNQIDLPSLAASDTVSGFVFQNPNASDVNDVVDRKSLEISCVNLIAKLENAFANAKELPTDDFIDESAQLARKMLDLLSSFSDEFLVGAAAEQANEEIARAMTYVHLFDEVLKTRPLTKTIIRTFWNIAESEEILISHAHLGDALVRGCAATLYHAIVMLGIKTKEGQEIDQSTVVFVTELKQSWN